jgi:hypothetical protein
MSWSGRPPGPAFVAASFSGAGTGPPNPPPHRPFSPVTDDPAGAAPISPGHPRGDGHRPAEELLPRDEATRMALVKLHDQMTDELDRIVGDLYEAAINVHAIAALNEHEEIQVHVQAALDWLNQAITAIGATGHGSGPLSHPTDGAPGH